jgi:glutamate racemase
MSHGYSFGACRCLIIVGVFCCWTLIGTTEVTKSQESRPSDLHRLIAAAIVPSESRLPYRFDASVFRADTRHLPIGVFDSGIGGLTVLEAILALDAFHNDTLSPGSDGRRDFENERFIYLGDQANMPYGNYASVGKENFLRELILKDAIFLLGKRYWPSNVASRPDFNKPPVKAIVIACNTATAYGLDDLRTAMKTWDIPIVVVGVVEAGARGVAESIDPSDGRRGVAVLATTGTCSSMAYPKAINASVGLAGKRVPEIIQQGSVGLAGAIEGDPAYIAIRESKSSGMTAYQGPSVQNTVAPIDAMHAKRYGFEESGLSGEPQQPDTWRLNSISNYARYDVLSLVEKYRATGGTVPIDTVVLGCTHFPLVQTEIQSAFAQLRQYQEDGHHPYRSLIADEIRLVNPAELTAKELFRALAKARLRFDGLENENRQRDQFYISVADPQWPAIRLNAEGGLDREYKYSRLTGQLDIEDTRAVPMTKELLPESSLNLIRTRLPYVWTRLSD